MPSRKRAWMHDVLDQLSSDRFPKDVTRERPES
jgi:hypothetical protein